MTLYKQIQLGDSTLYIYKPTFHLTVKGPIYFEVSVLLFLDLIVKFLRSTSTLLSGLYNHALSKVYLLRLLLTYLKVLQISL